MKWVHVLLLGVLISFSLIMICMLVITLQHHHVLTRLSMRYNDLFEITRIQHVMNDQWSIALFSDRNQMIDMELFSSYMMATLFPLGRYLKSLRITKGIYFSLFCLFSSLFVVIQSEGMLSRIFNNVSNITQLKVEMILLIWSLFLANRYTYHLDPQPDQTVTMKILDFLTLLLTFQTIYTTATSYTAYIYILIVYGVIISSLTVLNLIRVIQQHGKGSHLLVVGMLSYELFVITGILTPMGTKDPYLMKPMLLLLFIFTQTVYLSLTIKYSRHLKPHQLNSTPIPAQGLETGVDIRSSQTPRVASTILIIHDAYRSVSSLASMLRDEQDVVHTVSNGIEALELIIQGNRYDLLIVDVNPSGNSGVEISRIFKATYPNLDVPILLIVDKSMSIDSEASYLEVVNDIIRKPFDPIEVIFRVRTLIKLKKAEVKLHQAEMLILKAQIKPHFFYNALNTIVSFCYTDSHRAGELLTQFSRYLRNSFDFQDHVDYVSFHKELEALKAYLMLEDARFAERLQIQWSIDPQTHGCRVIPFAVQPIVENAIQHGIMSLEQGGQVTIASQLIDQDLWIFITDTGVGIAPEVLSSIMDMQTISRSFALRNIHARMIHLTGEGLQIESELGKGTKVSICIPQLR
jgi:CheY-like chemotaxis protein